MGQGWMALPWAGMMPKIACGTRKHNPSPERDSKIMNTDTAEHTAFQTDQ